MGEALELNDSNKQLKYTFRFGTSEKYVHLNQQQLDCIPYLMALVLHKDDFLSIQNENDEFVLSHPIEYDSFIVILHSITSKQPYTLFNELSEDNNILDTLQLFDYLGINSFSSPLLKNDDLVRLHPIKTDDNKKRVKYHQANIFEARQTAAQFIITLGKNEYNLNDFHTKQRIFYLIKVILFNETLFSSTFRHHTLTIVKEYCYSYFSKKQQHLLPTAQQIAQHRKIDSFMYLYNDDKPLPDNFQNAFAWKGIYMPIEENGTTKLSTNSDILRSRTALIIQTSVSKREQRIPKRRIMCPKIEYPTRDFPWVLHPTVEHELMRRSWIFPPSNFLRDYEYPYVNYQSSLQLEETSNFEEESVLLSKNKTKEESKLARSGCFNTLPKRPKIDKFKHRFGSKNQKYR